jgi:serine/threonine protein kinase
MDGDEQQWDEIASECKDATQDFSLADFRTLSKTESQEFVNRLPITKRGKAKRLYQTARLPTVFPINVPRILESELTMEEVMGQGTFSTVYRGTWTGQGVSSEVVAVKVPRRQGIHVDMVRELAILAGLPHENLLRLYGVCESSPPKIVIELMTTDLSVVPKNPRTRYQNLRILKDIAAGLAHLHRNDVIHRAVKPSNVLLRDDQTKLCDMGSAGTIVYMAPEVREGRPSGKAVDVWSFGVLLFELFVGHVPREDPVLELKKCGCLPALCKMFEMCHSNDPMLRPTMATIHNQLQVILMDEVNDMDNLKSEIRVALAQDLETYNVVWDTDYSNQPGVDSLLTRVKSLAQKYSSAVSQPCDPASLASLEALGNEAAPRILRIMRQVVEYCNGQFIQGPRKSTLRVTQKVREEYNGDYCRLMDLERATGLFTSATDFEECLTALSSHSDIEFARVKDRLNVSLSSGYRDVLLNMRDRKSGFLCELQLNFVKIAEITSQTNRFYELMRVMKVQA